MDNRINLRWNTIVACLACEEAQDLVEYGLVIALIAFGTLTALQSLGQDLSTIYSGISSTITQAMG